MELLILSSAGALALLSGIFIHLIASDLMVLVPSLARRSIERAVRKLPEEWRARYEEEWKAHLSECEGTLSMLWHALCCLVVARSVAQICKGHTLIESELVENEGTALEFRVHGVGSISMSFVGGLHVLSILKAALAGEPSILAPNELGLYEAGIGATLISFKQIAGPAEIEKLGMLVQLMRQGLNERKVGRFTVYIVDQLGRRFEVDFDKFDGSSITTLKDTSFPSTSAG
jgi:hypothetical protein